jgi:hypothetical protein
VALFQAAEKRGDTYDEAISYAIQGVMLSPHFLFRLESSTPDYALASRLSYSVGRDAGRGVVQTRQARGNWRIRRC